MIKESIILAGGLGTRLRSAIADIPKCMAPVAGKPFLAHVIDYYLKEGVERFIFSLGYMNQFIEDYLQREYRWLHYLISLEQKPLGTGGAIKLASTLVTGKNVIVLNGDTLFKVNLVEVITFHESRGAQCTLSVKHINQSDRYGIVELNTDSTIKNFREKNFSANGFINGGVYVLDVAGFLTENLPGKFSFENDYLEKYYSKRRIYGIVQEGYFIDIGIPEDLDRAQKEFPVA